MQKQLLLQLFKIINKNAYVISDTELNKIKFLSDEEIRMILRCQYFTIAFSLMMRDDLKRFGNDFLNQVIDLLNSTSSSEKADYVYLAATDEELIKRNIALDFAEIVSESIGFKSARNTYCLAQNQEVLNLVSLLDLATIISKTVHSDHAYDTATNSGVIQSGLAIELTNIVSKSLGSAQAYYACGIAVNKDVLQSGLVLELTKIVSQAVGDFEAEKAYEMAIKTDLMQNENFIARVSEIANGYSFVDFWKQLSENKSAAVQIINELFQDEPGEFDITPDATARVRIKKDYKS